MFTTNVFFLLSFGKIFFYSVELIQIESPEVNSLISNSLQIATKTYIFDVL